MHVSGLTIYPIKGCRGCDLAELEVDTLGPVGDRRYLWVDETGSFITQRTVPELTQIVPRLRDGGLEISCGERTIFIPKNLPHATSRIVSVWSSAGLDADDCGEEVAEWIEAVLGRRYRLVRIGPRFTRPVGASKGPQPGDVLGFADACPFLIVGQASLDDLNDRLVARGEEPIPMNRFRPNIVISGSAPFAEDTWHRIKIGQHVLRSAGRSVRCIVTTTDQLTGERHKEPLRTLAQFRRDPNKSSDVRFGENFIHETKSGVLRLGDDVSVI